MRIQSANLNSIWLKNSLSHDRYFTHVHHMAFLQLLVDGWEGLVNKCLLLLFIHLYILLLGSFTLSLCLVVSLVLCILRISLVLVYFSKVEVYFYCFVDTLLKSLCHVCYLLTYFAWVQIEVLSDGSIIILIFREYFQLKRLVGLLPLGDTFKDWFKLLEVTLCLLHYSLHIDNAFVLEGLEHYSISYGTFPLRRREHKLRCCNKALVLGQYHAAVVDYFVE